MVSAVSGSASQRRATPRLFQAVRGVTGMSREILAGVTLAALMIPLNIGYAEVASRNHQRETEMRSP
jgi:hypothetical protein